jgi:hypothetical protein
MQANAMEERPGGCYHVMHRNKVPMRVEEMKESGRVSGFAFQEVVSAIA